MQMNWIPVSERLPKFGERVLISTGTQYNTVKIATFDKMFYGYKGRWYCEDGGAFANSFIEAWMPLPEHYSEEKQGNRGMNSSTNL